MYDVEMVGKMDTSPSTSLLMITAMAPFVHQISPGLASAAQEMAPLEKVSARNTPRRGSPTIRDLQRRGGERRRGGMVIPKALFSQLPRTNSSRT